MLDEVNDMGKADNGSLPTPEFIIMQVCKHYSIDLETLQSKQRRKVVVEARRVAILLLRKMTTLSFQDIGKMFDRDHATIVNAFRKVETELQKNTEFKNTICNIVSRINNWGESNNV